MRRCQICNQPLEEGEEDVCYDCFCNIFIDEDIPPDFDDVAS